MSSDHVALGHRCVSKRKQAKCYSRPVYSRSTPVHFGHGDDAARSDYGARRVRIVDRLEHVEGDAGRELEPLVLRLRAASGAGALHTNTIYTVMNDALQSTQQCSTVYTLTFYSTSSASEYSYMYNNISVY